MIVKRDAPSYASFWWMQFLLIAAPTPAGTSTIPTSPAGPTTIFSSSTRSGTSSRPPPSSPPGDSTKDRRPRRAIALHLRRNAVTRPTLEWGHEKEKPGPQGLANLRTWRLPFSSDVKHRRRQTLENRRPHKMRTSLRPDAVLGTPSFTGPSRRGSAVRGGRQHVAQAPRPADARARLLRPQGQARPAPLIAPRKARP